jgi:serine/threonine protein phosphatase PrpC
MEDASIAVEMDEEISLFGVFDGHGGLEVAKFVQRYFADELKKNINYQKKNYGEALKENF